MSKKTVVSKKAVAPKKAAKKTSPAKATKKAVAPAAKKAAEKTPKAETPAPTEKAPRETKKAKAMEMLREGVSIFQLMEEFGWLRHTTRGFLSILSKTHKVESYKNEKGEHCYKLAA